MLTRRQRKILAVVERAERENRNWTVYLRDELARHWKVKNLPMLTVRNNLMKLAEAGMLERNEKAIGTYGFRWKLTENGRLIVLEDRPKNGGQSLPT